MRSLFDKHEIMWKSSREYMKVTDKKNEIEK